MNINDDTVEWPLATDPDAMALFGSGDEEHIQNMTDADWEQLGRDVANNTHLRRLTLTNRALSDHRMSSMFRGLLEGGSIVMMELHDNRLSAAGIQSMVPFLQNANNLTFLDLDENNIQSEGFNMLFRALRDSPIETLNCNYCGIESIEIHSEHIPKHLAYLFLMNNFIKADGCRDLAKLLLGSDSSLECLHLAYNKIDDDGVEILVDALQSKNTALTSLKHLNLTGNHGISKKGQIIALKLVNDISSIKATFQSNHALHELSVQLSDSDAQIQDHIDNAIEINSNSNPEAAGREKVIQTQLNSDTRSKLAEIQGVSQSLYSEINPLHLPEVLVLVSRHHGQGELFIALKSSIAGVISTVNRKECLKQQRAVLKARLEAIEAEIASIEAAEEQIVDIGREAPSNNKRRRK